MKSSIILIFSFAVLSCLFWQCTGSSGKNQEEPEQTDVYVRQFNTIPVAPATMAHELNLTGRLVALQKIDIVAQVEGIAWPTKKSFEPGVVFNKGEALVAIHDTEFRNDLTARKSQFLASLVRIMSDLKIDYPGDFPEWSRYLEKLDVSRSLAPLPEVKNIQLRYFLSANDIFNQYYTIKSQEEVLSRYIIRAPFTGAVIHAEIDPGGLVNPGVKLGELISTGQYEVRTAVSVGDIKHVQAGQKIMLSSKTMAGEWEAVINRIGKQVDPSTQSVPVYLLVSGNDLREGMYLEGKLPVSQYEDVVELPTALITRRNQVHIVENDVVKLKDVVPVEYQGKHVIVRGLSSGDEVITDEVTTPIQGIKAVSKR